MISGEQIIEPSKMLKNEYMKGKPSGGHGQRRSSQNRDSSGVKKTNIEVLDPETPIEQYQQYYQMQSDAPQHELHAQPLLKDQLNQLGPLFHGSSADQNQSNLVQNSVESDDLFGKLIYNIKHNQALLNKSVREQFKLHLIKDEEDLQNYKNLLNAMAAMFFSGHRMKVTQQEMFDAWLSKAR